MAETEVLRVVHIGADHHIIAVVDYGSERRDAVALPLRKIVADLLRFDTAAALVAHNHPGGSLQPSRADIHATRLLARVIAPLGVRLHDHLITTAQGRFSFREAGLL